MFDTLLESRTVGAQVRSRWAFPIAVLSHVTVVGALIAASLLVTVSLKEPPGPLVLEIVTALPLPPPLPRGSAPAPTPRRAEQSPPEPVTEEVLQPETLPEQPIHIEEAESGDPGDGDAVLGGVPDGDPFGVPEGDPNGVQDGVAQGTGTQAPTDTRPRIVTPEMTPPRLVRKVEPEYPEPARVIRQEGRVFLQAVISATGRVEEVTVLRSSNPLFEQAAIDAVRQWEYEPARQGDRTVAVYFTIDVRFTLQ